MVHKILFCGLIIFNLGCSTLSPTYTRDPSSQIDPDTLWVHLNERKDSLIRSNPAHFWAWMKINTPDQLKSATQWTGQVTADPHFFNFGDIHSPGRSGLALVDVDDSGRASLYYDFVRYSLFVKAYLNLDLTAQLFDSYLMGLNKQSLNRPKILMKAMKPTYSDLLLHHENWVLSHVDESRKLINKDLGLMGFKKLQIQFPEKVKLGEELRAALIREKKANIIYDIGFKQNDTGSSRGMSRFWFSLLDRQDRIRILECKELGPPSTNYFELQASHFERIQNVLNIYSDFKTNESFVFNVSDHSYWCRPKHFEFLDREVIENKLTTEQQAELAIYFSFWLGQKQILQAEAESLKKVLIQNKKIILNETIQLIQRYENHVFQLK